LSKEVGHTQKNYILKTEEREAILKEDKTVNVLKCSCNCYCVCNYFESKSICLGLFFYFTRLQEGLIHTHRIIQIAYRLLGLQIRKWSCGISKNSPMPGSEKWTYILCLTSKDRNI
jgi:hypothetical protein